MESVFEIIAEPNRRADIESPGLVTTVGWRDRASASYDAADRVKALRVLARRVSWSPQWMSNARLYRLKPEPFRVEAWLDPFRRF